MPLIYESSYSKRPPLYFNSYLETLIPYFNTQVNQVQYERERLELEDGDFLDLDWVRSGSNKLMVVTHGFEGNTRDVCIEKSAAYFFRQGFDVLLWNLRSCSNELNRLPRFYHHGDIEDLDAVINHGIKSKKYDEIIVVGFSLGGSIIINYFGSDLPGPLIKGGVAISAPLDIAATSNRISTGWNRILLEPNFLAKIKNKVLRKAELFPDLIDKEKVRKIKSLKELLTDVVLHLNGFSTREDYFKKWSCLEHLQKIERPLLILNAKNDPLLSANDFPYERCKESEHVYLESPAYGGHVGFSKKLGGEFWYLKRIDDFIEGEIEVTPQLREIT